jgi:glycosidase
MKNFKNPSDAMVREDFPGGFAGDASNKFQAQGRTPAENAAFDFVSRLANYRKNSSALTRGKLMQYIPSGSVYVYFRYDEKQTVLCALNADTVAASIRFSDYKERTGGFQTATNIMTGANYPLSEKMALPARSITLLELKRRTDANKVVN